jgi:hypothetical protein
MHKAFHDAGRRDAGRRESGAQAKTGLTQLDPLDSDLSHPELDSHQLIEANTSRKKVSMGD